MIKPVLRSMFIFALAGAACNTEDPPAQSQGDTQAAPGSATGDPSVVHHPEPPARPESRQDSMQIEGAYERFTATLVKPPSSLPFSTYLPKDMIFEPASSGEGEGYYFFTNFAGKRNDNAFMLVFLLPAGRNAADARKLADAVVNSRAGTGMITHVQPGSYNGRHFYVARVYPREYSEGMGARAHYIRSQWVWLNDGKSLQSTLLPPHE